MTYAAVIEKQVKMYEGWINQAKKMEHHARMVERLIAEFPLGHYNTSVFGNDVDVTYRLKSTTQLERMLKYFRAFGYRSNRGKDDPANRRRTFFIGQRDARDPKATVIKFEAYFLDDEATCKYVEVGTKTVEAVPAVEAHEIPVYELQCDDAEVPEAV